MQLEVNTKYCIIIIDEGQNRRDNEIFLRLKVCVYDYEIVNYQRRRNKDSYVCILRV